MDQPAPKRPILGITMGDPCGIGPEVLVKALATGEFRSRARFVIFGLAEQIAYVADQLEADISFFRDHHENIRRYPHDVTLLDFDEITLPPVLTRGPSIVGGRASMAFCERAIAAAKERLIDGLVTAPISKASWYLAGFKKFPGHTELLAKRFDVPRVAMMFASPRLRVILATTHVGLMEIRDKLTIGCVFNPIDMADKALRQWFGVARPRIGVAGLNPHAGEDGAFGDEEQRVIGPAVLLAREAGIDATGPHPADTLFVRALEGRYDCVVAMYHDQGLIPVKMFAWRNAVNLTLGLPIVRTSPDHGTAFDIAGRNVADPSSMTEAIRLCLDLTEKRLAAAAG